MAVQVVLVLCLFATMVFGDDGCGVSNVDEAIDKFLEENRIKMDETFPLESVTDGPVVMEEGQVWGLNTIYRNGSAKVSCNDGVDRIEILFSMAKPLRVRYEWKAGRLFKLKGVAYARSNTFQAKAVAVRQSDGSWKLEDLQVLDLSDIQVDVTGLAHVSWVWSKITSFFANRLEGIVALVIEEPLREIFNKALAQATL